MTSTTSGIRKHLRRAWAFFIDTVEWTSNGDRRRPRFSERSDIFDPSAGWTQPDRVVRESLDAERQGRHGD